MGPLITAHSENPPPCKIKAAEGNVKAEGGKIKAEGGKTTSGVTYGTFAVYRPTKQPIAAQGVALARAKIRAVLCYCPLRYIYIYILSLSKDRCSWYRIEHATLARTARHQMDSMAREINTIRALLREATAMQRDWRSTAARLPRLSLGSL